MNNQTTIQEVVDYLHSVAPNHLQEAYDNAGLIVGHGSRACTGVVTCLDSTEAVIDEAIALGCNMVIAHHPIVFRGLKRFNGTTYVERVVMKAIANDVAIFAIHTNLDNVMQYGVNERIGQQLGLTECKILAPKDPAEATVGSGLIGELKTPMEEQAFLLHLKETMKVSVIKHTDLLAHPVHKVAVCGGSGGFLLEAAVAAGAQVFITADYKYHEYFNADGRIVIADIGHFESEQFTINLLHELVTRKFRTFAAHCTNVVTNPINYL